MRQLKRTKARTYRGSSFRLMILNSCATVLCEELRGQKLDCRTLLLKRNLVLVLNFVDKGINEVGGRSLCGKGGVDEGVGLERLKTNFGRGSVETGPAWPSRCHHAWPLACPRAPSAHVSLAPTNFLYRNSHPLQS